MTAGVGHHQVVFEGGAAKKSDYRRFKIRGLEEGVPDDFAAMNEVYGRHLGQSLPARTTIAAAGLPKGARVEIDLVARVRPQV